MKIELISYSTTTVALRKIALTKKLYNKSTSDIILFAGHTIEKMRDLKALAKGLCNDVGTVAFFELKEIGAMNMTNWSFMIVNNTIINSNSNQQFAFSKQINKNELLADNLLATILNSRLQKVKRKKVCLLICGELNILANVQTQGNKVVVRSKRWKKEFQEIFKSTDIILNPQHTPMGNQGKLKKRREYFSKNNKAYFSTANTEFYKEYAEDSFRNSKSLQYAFYNGRPIAAISEIVTSEFLSRVYQI